MEVFDDTFVPPGLGDVWFATRGCPRCLASRLERVRSSLREPGMAAKG